MWKSETSGIQIPDVIMADDGSACTEMSDIQSPLSVARKKMTAHMINERITMLKKGMTPQEIVAHYEKLESGGKKKNKSSSRSSKTKNAKAPAIPEAIPEVPDLFFSAESPVGRLPPPPFGMTEDLASASSRFRKGQRFKEMMRERPSHFQAFQEKGSEARLRQDRFNMQDAPRPSHFSAFEEGSYSSGKKNRLNQQNGVIQTKSLQRMRTRGDAAPPHYLALEMESKKTNRKAGSGGHMRRRSSVKKNDGEVEESSHYKSKKLDEKLNSLRDHFDYGKRTNDADLSAEVSAFWAKQRKTQKANSMKKLEQASPQKLKTTKLARARTSDAGSASSNEYPLVGTTTTTKPMRARTSDAAGTMDYSMASSHRRVSSGDVTRTAASDTAGTMDYSMASSHRRASSGDGLSSGTAFLTRTERLHQPSSDCMEYSAPVFTRSRSSSSDGMKKLERSSTERREPHRKMEKMLAAEKKEASNARKSDGNRRESNRKAERRNSGDRKAERRNSGDRKAERHNSGDRKAERRNSGEKKRSSGYQVQMRVSSSRSPPPPESRSRTPPKSHLLAPPVSWSSQQQLPPPPPTGGSSSAFDAPVVSNLDMADVMNDAFNESFVQNDLFENGSFKYSSTVGTRKTAAASRSGGNAEAHRLRGTDLLGLEEDGDGESMNDSARGAFGPVKINPSFRMVKQNG